MLRTEGCNAEAAALAVATLRRGGVAILPTDTLYGFTCLWHAEAARERIAAAKGYGEERLFICLVSSIEMAAEIVSGWGATRREQLAKMWPAPLTAILPADPIRVPFSSGSVALRVPDDSWLRGVIAVLGAAVVSTSVNRRDEAPLVRAADIEGEFAAVADLIVVDDRPPQPPSTIVDFTGKKIKVVRQGAYAFAMRGKPSN